MLETADSSTRSPPKLQERWDLYRTLAEPLRLRLLALVAEEELAVGELAELLKESQPNVSRAATPLREAGLVSSRKDGTRVLLRLHEAAHDDAVVADALASGKALVERDGSLARVPQIVAARDLAARAYFDAPRERDPEAMKRPPAELGAYLFALSTFHDAVALDAGTGDGGLLDVLSPAFSRVIAVDRSSAQLEAARQRIQLRGYRNVKIVEGELESADVKKAVGKGVDVIFAVRLLHHASKPAELLATMASLLGPNGRIVVLDYARHEDESMRHAGDVWLGFDAKDLQKIAKEGGVVLESAAPIGSTLVSAGPDAHLPWQLLKFKKQSEKKQSTRKNDHG